jgi:hypothetical protein
MAAAAILKIAKLHYFQLYTGGKTNEGSTFIVLMIDFCITLHFINYSDLKFKKKSKWLPPPF